MVQIARFITTSRGDLFDMTRRLIGAVEGGILQDPDNPLLLTVRGSHSSGKKIIADECRMVIFHQCQMSGQQDFDEYYTGTYNGQKRALHYIDAAWGTGYSNPQLDDPSDKKAMNAFMSARQGVDGITILQNPGDFAADKGIGFFVENKRD
ncbi:MAG: hypothetical protein KJ667_08785, partial [Alphaproteobacteria bacterium]|nr:hypothetical protein [Alphaproteobacteria bacterium]